MAIEKRPVKKYMEIEMTSPYPTFDAFIDRLVYLNVILDPEWELKLYQLNRRVFKDRQGYPLVYEPGKHGRVVHLHRLVNNTPSGRHTDHINGDPSDCRAVNLRTVYRHQNALNTKRPKNNRSGFKGVSFDKTSALWAVRIEYRGTRYRRKFKSLEDAVAFRDELERQLHGNFRRKVHTP